MSGFKTRTGRKRKLPLNEFNVCGLCQGVLTENKEVNSVKTHLFPLKNLC